MYTYILIYRINSCLSHMQDNQTLNKHDRNKMDYLANTIVEKKSTRIWNEVMDFIFQLWFVLFSLLHSYIHTSVLPLWIACSNFLVQFIVLLFSHRMTDCGTHSWSIESHRNRFCKRRSFKLLELVHMRAGEKMLNDISNQNRKIRGHRARSAAQMSWRFLFHFICGNQRKIYFSCSMHSTIIWIQIS